MMPKRQKCGGGRRGRCGDSTATMRWWWAEVQMVTVIVGIVVGSCIGNVHADLSASAVKQHDLCQDDGAGMQCPPGRVVHVQGTRCADSGQPCDPDLQATLLRLCQGRRSCAALGLPQVFGTLCHRRGSPQKQDRRVVVSYSCRQAPPAATPACGVNLCSSVTRGFSCPQNSVLHVQNVTCQAGGVTCSSATFLTLYSLCEGRQECDASGLRLLTPLSMYCQHSASPPHLRNVFVDFVCVPISLVQDQCQERSISLTEPFGVVMNPGFAGRVATTNSVGTSARQCHWLLTPRDPEDVMHVTVHMAYSKWRDRGCSNTHVLQVDYKNCERQEHITRKFCNLSHINSHIKACSNVRVTSWVPADSGDNHRFLLSYQAAPRGSEVATPDGMLECHTPLATPLPTLPIRTTRPTPIRRNYGPGKTMFDYSDTIRHIATDSENGQGGDDDAFQLKLMVLYVFFGVVILALVIALIYVLISYRGISRRGRHASDSSEKTALWRHEDTPLDTFNHNSHATLADVANCNLYPPSPETSHHNPDGDARYSDDPQVVACTVHAESTDEEENRLSTGSAFSSFLSGKDMDLQDLLDSFNSPSSPTAEKDTGDYDSIAGKDSGDYDVIAGKDSGDYDSIAGKDTGDYDIIADTTDGPSREGSEGGTKNCPRSSSFMMNGDVGNIYESIDDQHFPGHGQSLSASRQGDTDFKTPQAQHPLAVPRNDPSYVEHYTINDDDYALVRKPKVSQPMPTNMYMNSIQPEVDQTSPHSHHDQGMVDSFQDMTGHGNLTGLQQSMAEPKDKDLGLKWGKHI